MRVPEDIEFVAVVDGKRLTVVLSEGKEIGDCPCVGCKAIRELLLTRYTPDELRTQRYGRGEEG